MGIVRKDCIGNLIRDFKKGIQSWKQINSILYIYRTGTDSWRLEPTDKLPVGKKTCLSLREMEKQIGYDLNTLSDPMGKNITGGVLFMHQDRSEAEYHAPCLPTYLLQ